MWIAFVSQRWLLKVEYRILDLDCSPQRDERIAYCHLAYHTFTAWQRIEVWTEVHDRISNSKLLRNLKVQPSIPDRKRTQQLKYREDIEHIHKHMHKQELFLGGGIIALHRSGLNENTQKK